MAADTRYRFFRDDITDAKRMAEVFAAVDPDVVMHLAAETHVDRSIDSAAPFIHTNIAGTAVLLDAALRHWRGLSPARRGRFRFHISRRGVGRTRPEGKELRVYSKSDNVRTGCMWTTASALVPRPYH